MSTASVAPPPELATRRRIAHAVLGLTIAGLVLLAAWPPGGYHWYPPCPIYRWFGILCPGCGATRALAALVRGDLREALRQNPLAVLLLPAATAMGLHCYRRALSRQAFQWPRIPGVAIAGLVLAAAAFTLLRNTR